jgi:hypothetical protein
VSLLPAADCSRDGGTCLLRLADAVRPCLAVAAEIGGDAQSTDGTEASHMHTAAELHAPNFKRGYEAWLMVEAKKRNPSIKLYALPWAWPGWLRNATTGGANPLLDNTALAVEYVSSWVAGMKTTHGLTIDYVSIWNEVCPVLRRAAPRRAVLQLTTPCLWRLIGFHSVCLHWSIRTHTTLSCTQMDADLQAGSRVYIKALRKALNAKGFASTRIVACDGHSYSDITKLFVGDPELVDAVDVLGAH